MRQLRYFPAGQTAQKSRASGGGAKPDSATTAPGFSAGVPTVGEPLADVVRRADPGPVSGGKAARLRPTSSATLRPTPFVSPRPRTFDGSLRSMRTSPRNPPCDASSRCETPVAISPTIRVDGTGRTDRPAVHRGGCGVGGRGVSGLGSSRTTMHTTPLIALHDTADDLAAGDADGPTGTPHRAMPRPTYCRGSFRIARVYTAPRRTSYQQAQARCAFGSFTSSSAQRTHDADRSRDARMLVAARPWTPTSTWLTGDGPPSFG